MDKIPDKIKVCHFTSAHQWNDVRIFLKECKSLASAGYEVYLVHSGNKNGVEDGVHIWGTDHSHKSRFARMLHTAASVYKKALECDADIYHFHDPELLQFAGKFKQKKKKIIYDVHEDVPRQILGKYWIPKILRKLIASVFEVYENRQARKVDLIVAATPFIRSRFSNLNEKTIDVCNYPLLTEFNTNTKPRVKNKVCYIGALTEIRGIKEIVQAIEGTSIELHLAGNFSPDSFREELKSLKGWSNVTERGFLNRLEVAELMATSEIGLVTLYPQQNYLDSLPIKMFEYMLAGLPVVASDFPLWKAILAKNKCGITVNPKNSDAIKNLLLDLLAKSDVLSEMGNKGKEAAIREYNWQIEAEKLLHAYRLMYTES
jgi:glycosyltransferase involved in cell wall biosynthesis